MGVILLFSVPSAVGSAAFSALCSYVVVVLVCLYMLWSGECVCACGLWIVLYVVSLGCGMMGPDRFVLGELEGCRILGNDGKYSEACGLI